MEICITMKKTCIFAKNKRCRAPKTISCIDALTLTAEIESYD